MMLNKRLLRAARTDRRGPPRKQIKYLSHIGYEQWAQKRYRASQDGWR